MGMKHLVVGFVIGLFVGVVSASTLEVGKIGFTKDGIITYLKQACSNKEQFSRSNHLCPQRYAGIFLTSYIGILSVSPTDRYWP